jgi:UDP-glucose 4-epimerase
MAPDNSAVVIGSNGFIGRSIAKELSLHGFECRSLSRLEIDLNSPTSALNLHQFIRPESILVFAAARAPAKTESVLAENIQMVKNLFHVIKDIEFSYFLNVSSDAVYPDLSREIDETVEVAPTSIHGSMHAQREMILNLLHVPVGHIRPTLVYGALDPHNGYGPNLFTRLALSKLPIRLYGSGEELRDHIEIRDVARIAVGMIVKKHTGPINAVSGIVHSFKEIAEVISQIIPQTRIEYVERNGPIPHNGYRAFKIDKVRNLLINYKAIDLKDGLADLISEVMVQNGRN